METSTVKIYTLEDPTTGIVRYVGKTKLSLNERLQGHIDQAKEKGRRKNHRLAWITNILNSKLRPVIKELDTVLENEWQFWEVYWIAQIKSWGFNLVNGDSGGLGGHRMTQETKAKIIATKKLNNSFRQPNTYKHSVETIEKIKCSKAANPYAGYWKSKVLHPNTRMAQIKAVSGKRTLEQMQTKFKKGLIKSVIMNGCIPFETIKEAAVYISSVKNNSTSLRSVSQKISHAAKYNTSYYGYSFNY